MNVHVMPAFQCQLFCIKHPLLLAGSSIRNNYTTCTGFRLYVIKSKHLHCIRFKVFIIALIGTISYELLGRLTDLFTCIVLEVLFNCNIFLLCFYGQQVLVHISAMFISTIPIHPNRMHDNVLAPISTNTLSPWTYLKRTIQFIDNILLVIVYIT